MKLSECRIYAFQLVRNFRIAKSGIMTNLAEQILGYHPVVIMIDPLPVSL